MNGKRKWGILWGSTAARNKAELVNSKSWSLRPYIRAERVVSEWQGLTTRAGKVYDQLPKETQPAFFQLVYMLCAAQENLNKLHIAGQSSFASQNAFDLEKSDM